MEVRLTFRILTLFIVLLTVSSHSVFGRAPRPTKPEVDGKRYAVLLIGDHEGIDEIDVRNAALLVAKELRAQGITVGDPVHEAPASANVYRIVLRRSGKKILFRLSEEDTAGTLIIEREVLLADIEDIVSSTSRLVLALVHREPVISPTSFLDVGVFGTTGSPSNAAFSFGAGLGGSIDRLSYSVDITGRLSSADTRNRNFSFHSMSVGGRYYLRKRNRSVYIGGGLGMMYTEYSRTSGVLFWKHTTHYEEKLGMGAYGVLGIEFLRSSHNRLTLELRVDRPFFTLESRDVMPITLGITFSAGRLSHLGRRSLF